MSETVWYALRHVNSLQMLLVRAIERHCCVISLLASLSSWKLDGIVEVRYETSLVVEFLVYFWQSGERARHNIIEEL